MKRSHAAIIIFVAATALLGGGWFFRTQTTAEPTYCASLAGGAHVSVRFESGTAENVAERLAAEYRSSQWEELPGSTRTFKLFSRNNKIAAFLAEDTPQGGARLTEYRNTQQTYD